MAKQRFRKEQVAEALHRARGMVAGAAQFLGCSPRTLLRYIARYPELEQVRDEARAEVVERVELKLMECALDGEPWAVRFLLRNWKPETYSEKYRFVHQAETPLQFELDDSARAVLYELLQRITE